MTTPNDPSPAPAENSGSTADVLPSASAAIDARAKEPEISLDASRHFGGWLAEQQISLAFTTYQAGKVLMLGVDAERRPSLFGRSFSRCMGLWADPNGARTLWVSGAYQLWRLENILDPGQLHEGHDRLYVPHESHITADLDTHDIAVEQGGRLIFVNTLCSCIATLSPNKSFTPLWKPPAISKIGPEDRCHLNGLALENGRAAYVTACSSSDVASGWRDRRRDGGVLVDVRTNQTVLAGLSMPHSPRLHNGQLYLHNSGSGYFGRVDRAAGKFEPICFCPGYLRGLAFIRDYAIVGLSKPRDITSTGLALDDELARRDAVAQCALQVIDLRSGHVIQWVKLEGAVSELYDVVVLPGVVRPMVLGFKTDEIDRTISIDKMGQL